MSRLELRRATEADAERLGQAVHEAFESYRSIAPEGWTPPPREGEAARIRALLALDEFWCLIAERGGELAGHVGFIPARIAIFPIDDSSLAHLRLLFVEPPFHGTGLARELHDAAMDEAAGRGFEAIRLFTPADQARARRFYEREGWSVAAEPFDADFGLSMVEYRRTLGRR